MINQLSNLADTLKQREHLLAAKKVTIGFDGFIDTIAKIIHNKEEQSIAFFNRIKEFGNYILEKEGSSFSLELQEISVRHGGNMPITANALGQLGIQVNCIGATGYPRIHPAFESISPNCSFYSFAEPGTSAAYEFNDGKIFLASMGKLNSTGWNEIKSRVGLDTLIQLYKECDLISIVNWSEIDLSSEIWKGILKDILPAYTGPHKKQIAFFDLSDCSKRTGKEISEVFSLLEEFSLYTKVILSVNRNEARLLHKVLYKKDSHDDLAQLGQSIFQKLQTNTLVVHSSKEAIAYNNEEMFKAGSFFTETPVISTGAGDNFNAGFCAAQLSALDMQSSVIFANAVSGLYIRTGASPMLKDVIRFFETNPDY